MAWMPTEIEDPSPAMGVGRTLGTHVAVSVGKVSEVFRAATTMDHVTEVSVSEKKVERRSGRRSLKLMRVWIWWQALCVPCTNCLLQSVE